MGNRVCQLANMTTKPQLRLLFQSVFGTNHLVCLVLKPIIHYSLALTSIYADYGPPYMLGALNPIYVSAQGL